MKSLYVHYINKYPGGRVIQSESSLDVYSQSGEHVVAMRKNGAGQMVCVSEEYGLRDRHSLEPIPKESRIFKVRDGKVALDEKAEERKESMKAFLCPQHGDKVLSCEELKALGHRFDEKQRQIKE